MKNLRIVIVSWNVATLLEKCLKSLPKACEDLEWECVVVDNASSDTSCEVVRKIVRDVPQIRLIAQTTNYGFAKACNVGAQGSDATYVLFLNPDTECPPGSLATFVQHADTRPRVGIFGPTLRNPDGTVQPSVRRFPTWRDQLGILFKLHHIFRSLPIFKNYFADDFDYGREQYVDQVMGACFLVRKELLDAKMGFDERYFIWMEEVDFCKTAKQAGWEVAYMPQAAITHIGGPSFAQVFSVKKQRYFTASLKKYFDKWYPGPQAWIIHIGSYIGLFLAYCASLLKTSWGPWLCIAVMLEILSLTTIFNPFANTIACLGLGVLMCVVACKRPHAAMAALALELVLGSKGYALQIGGWPSHISIRIVLTAAFLCGWFLNAVKSGHVLWSIKQVFSHKSVITLFALVAFAIVRGYAHGYQDWLADANAWFALVLIVPVIDISERYREKLRQHIVPALIVGFFVLAVMTLGLEFIFSHQFPYSAQLYLWVRRTGLGEITKLAGSFYRIFFQSHVYMIPAWIFAASHLVYKENQLKNFNRLVLGLASGVLFLSMSRSFVLGFVAGAGMLCLLFLQQKKLSLHKIGTIVSSSVLGGICALVLIIVPVPGVGSISPFEVLDTRLNDAAAQSRWELLPALWKKIQQAPMMGHGFGATVTYRTFDPRIVESGNAASYTTYAFEWGWLEQWVKFGILGIPVLLWVLISLMRRVWKSNEEMWIRVSALSSIVALATLHVFTPYLNHPLGFLFLFLSIGMLYSSTQKQIWN